MEVACQKITSHLLELMHSLLSRTAQRGSNNTIPHPSPPSSANSSSCYNNGYACSISCFDPWCQGCYFSAHCACNGKAQMHERERAREKTYSLSNQLCTSVVTLWLSGRRRGAALALYVHTHTHPAAKVCPPSGLTHLHVAPG